MICSNSTVVSSSHEMSKSIVSLPSLESLSNESSLPTNSNEKKSSETSSSSVLSAETTVAPHTKHVKCPNVRTTLVLRPEKVIHINFSYISLLRISNYYKRNKYIQTIFKY